MFSTTNFLLAKGQFKTRLKSRMVGFIPKVIPRKMRGNLVAFRSEANTGYFKGSLKTEEERTDLSGKKPQRIEIDPIINRYVVMKEVKIKGPFLTKAHIVAKKAELPK